MVARTGEFFGLVGRGIGAGVFGTAAMTLSSMVEMNVRGRGPTDMMAKAAGRVLGVQP